MSDTSNPFSGILSSYFFQNGPGVNLKLRERIALAQMMQKRAHPKTFGEGLAAIGDALGDRASAVDLERLDRAGLQDVVSNRAPAGASTDPVVQRAPDPPPLAAAAAALPDDPPPQAVPPDQQQAYTTDAPTRMPPSPYRPGGRQPGVGPPMVPPAVQPPPPPPPQGTPVAIQPPQQVAPPLPPAETAPAPPFGAGSRFDAAFPGRQSSLQPPPGTPVMAEGNEPSAEERSEGRAMLARAIMQQQAARGGPPPNPTAPGAGSRQIEPAAPVIRQAPPPSEIPVQPGAVAGWVPSAPGRVRGVDILGPSPRETQLHNFLLSKQGNPYWEQSPEARELAALQGNRKLRQQELEEDRKAEIARGTEQFKSHLTGRTDQADRIQKFGTGQIEQETKRLQLEDAREQSILQTRFGGRKPEEVWKEFDSDREGAKKTVHALTQFGVAQDMIKKGVIVGTAQGWKVNAAKVAAAFGDKDAGSAISRTEQLQAALKSTLALAVENIQGAGGKVSDTDVRIAEGTIGADPALQLETIKSLVERGEKAAQSKIEKYNTHIDTFLGGTRAVDRYRVKAPERQPDPPPQAEIPEFRTEAAAAAASRSLPKNANGKKIVRINGRLAEID